MCAVVVGIDPGAGVPLIPVPGRAAAAGGGRGPLPGRGPGPLPFHLLLADSAGARLWHWDGTALRGEVLPPGTHMIVNSGWERGEENERVAFFRVSEKMPYTPHCPDVIGVVCPLDRLNA